MQSQRQVFRRRVRDFMGPPTLAIAAGATVEEAVGAMTEGKASCAVVVDAERRVVGILTEQDVTRRIAFRATPQTGVEAIMSEGVKAIGADDYLYRAIARMRRFGHRHMPVIDADGRLAGHLDLHDALADMSAPTMDRIELLTREGTLDGLREVKAAQIELAADLFADEVPASEIQALLTDVNNDIYRRVTEGVLAAMAEEGKGAPPVGFAVIVMGSGGRGENYLYPDQDNGFILADYPDAEHDRIDAWFTALALRVNDALARIGFPLCKGYVMAQNPLWRKTESQWREQISGWQSKRDVAALRLADIFFDFKGVYGDPAMAGRLRAHVTGLTKGNRSFLKEMFRDDAEHGVALGWFGRFITVRDEPAHKGKINLKHTGSLPIIDAVRLLALREGIEAGPTLARIEALAEAGVLDADEQDYLSGAFRHIVYLLLRQQLRDHAAGAPVGHYVAPRALSMREKDYLRDCLRAIRAFRARLRSEFTGEVF
jgi:signal-transduction protein with cAMP-binding, CBS, and nucleotidyltransferase domain